MDSDNRFSLPNGYRLNEYVIEKVLGQGGFGITYLAHDSHLDRKVAVKEFMPFDLAAREAGRTVVPRSPSMRKDYGWGLQRFLKEARTLAQFSHPNIVQILTLFEANNTAYIVMCYETGESLDVHLKAHGGTLSADELLALAEPLLDGLEAVHKAGFLHRDIKPSNIFLRTDGRPILLDFGTARQTVGSHSRSMASILTPCYAPIEQYTVDGNQGTWTDIYAIGAVFYTCVSGRAPPEAPARMEARSAGAPDPLKPAQSVGRGRYPEAFLKEIDRSLTVLARDRPRSTASMRQVLLTCRQSRRGGSSALKLPRRWPVLAAAAAVVLLTAPAIIVFTAPPERSPEALSGGTASLQTAGSIPTPGPSGASDQPWDEAALSTAREAIQVSTVYGRQIYRRFQQQEALPSLERLASMNTRYQKQLDDVRQGLQRLDQETASLLQQYIALVDRLAKHPDSFKRIKARLLESEMSEAGRLARQHLIDHVETKQRGAANASLWKSNLDRTYMSRELW